MGKILKTQKNIVDIQQFDRFRYVILNSMITKSKHICCNFISFKFGSFCKFIVSRFFFCFVFF
jgi:hypothetical protein